MYSWDPRQARLSLVLFMVIAAAGMLKLYLTRPNLPDQAFIDSPWPPAGCLVDATVLRNRSLEVFPGGTTIAVAIKALGLYANPRESDFCLTRAGVLFRSHDRWQIRPMTQLERWIWRIPMDVHRAGPQDLSRIDGIGPRVGAKVHNYVAQKKCLDSLDDLLHVPGIGPARLKKLKEGLALE